MRKHPSIMALTAAIAAGLLGASQAAALGTISYVGKTSDVTDLSTLPYGSAGYWFAQFNASAPVSNAAIDDNDRDNLPSWIAADFTPPDTSFGDLVYSRGGETSWNSFTLPDGSETGLSGSLADPQGAANSNNIISRLDLAAGAPASFLFSVVVDNTNGAHNPDNRFRARGEDGVSGLEAEFRVETTSDLTFNGIADVYTFRYDGWVAGDFIKMQMRSSSPNILPGFAGLMFDVIPEPASGALLTLATAGLLAARRRHG